MQYELMDNFRVKGNRDWLVLSAVLLATCLGVLNTAMADLPPKHPPLDPTLNGQIVWALYADSREFCAGGIPAVQAKEDARASAAIARGEMVRPINVRAIIEGSYARKGTAELLEAYNAALAQAPQTGWTRDTTFAMALECELQRRTP